MLEENQAIPVGVGYFIAIKYALSRYEVLRGRTGRTNDCFRHSNGL